MDGEPRNAASEAARVGFERLNRLREFDDVEMADYRARFADDFVREDRRRLVGVPSSDREEWLESIQAYWKLGRGSPTFSVADVVSVRGARLTLFRARVEYAQGPATEMLIVYQLSSDLRAQRAVMFDADDLDAAMAELDRLHADLSDEDAPLRTGFSERLEHPVAQFFETFITAWNGDDLAGVRALLHSDLYAESHRTFTALGTVRGGAAHEALLSFHVSAPHCDFEVVETRPSGHAAGRWLLDDGGVAELEIPVVVQVVSGLLVRCATFDAGDLEGALALLREWAPTESPTGE